MVLRGKKEELRRGREVEKEERAEKYEGGGGSGHCSQSTSMDDRK